MSSLTHFDDAGASRMVDVSEKPVTARAARAEAVVEMEPATLVLIRNRQHSKGDVFEVARLAGIQAAKHTSLLIPLCHVLPLDGVSISFDVLDDRRLRIEAEVKVTARTGVEMEALTAATVSALTVYDMCKAVDRAMTIQSVRLLEKSGGRSGHFTRDSASHPPD